MTSTRRSVRVLIGAGTLAGTLALSACGSGGVMHDGTVAASYKGHSISTSEVQDAVRDINVAAPQAQFTAQSVIVYMMLGPALSNLASKYGVAHTDGQAKALFPTSLNVSKAAIATAKSNLDFASLKTNSAAQDQLVKVMGTKFKVNPRYGVWDPEQQVMSSTPENWITTQPTDNGDTGGSGGGRQPVN